MIDAFAPELLVNLGTCGGLTGHVARGEVLLADETLVYDIVEQMTDADEAIAAFTTAIDLSWLGPAPYPSPVRRARLVSADGDIAPSQVGVLRARFAAVAADWETGAIAWTAARNGVPCLILRAVSDLVDATGGEVYDDYGEFERRSLEVMDTLFGVLPRLACGVAPAPVRVDPCLTASACGRLRPPAAAVRRRTPRRHHPRPSQPFGCSLPWVRWQRVTTHVPFGQLLRRP